MTVSDRMLAACQRDWAVILDETVEHDIRVDCALRIALIRTGLGVYGNRIDEFIVLDTQVMDRDLARDVGAIMGEAAAMMLGDALEALRG